MPKRRKLKAASALPVKRCKIVEEPPFKAPVRVSKKKMSKVKVLATPEKKEYKVIELENGLNCQLIADFSYPLEKLDEEEAEEEEEEGSDEEGEEEEESDDENGDSDGESEDEEGGRPGGVARSTGNCMS